MSNYLFVSYIISNYAVDTLIDVKELASNIALAIFRYGIVEAKMAKQKEYVNGLLRLTIVWSSSFSFELKSLCSCYYPSMGEKELLEVD